MPPVPLLSVDSLRVTVGGVAVLHGVSLAVEPGEILGLVGASGSGKSMTALAIMQLLPPHARLCGSVILDGTALTGADAAALRSVRGRRMGMVFQEPMRALNPLMRIGDQVAETVRVHGADSAAGAAALARETLESVGLGRGATERFPHELSGGQRQRAALAAAIVLRPALLIADEPTTALDVATQAQVLTLLGELVRGRGMGLILVSHDLAVIAGMSDRLAVMRGGEIVEQGATAETLRDLRHPYSRALLAAARPVRRRRKTVAGEAVVLEARGIVRDYPLARRSLWGRTPAVRAVADASLSVRAGETVALVGESGSGKSTLLRAILGLERPQSGEVVLLGEPFSTAIGRRQRRLRRSLQAVFQDPDGSFDPRWPVAKLIAEPFHLMDPPPGASEQRRRVAAVLERVGLSARDAQRLPHEFSGGERQRIAVARALITEPAVIAFDEALSALDVLVRAQILDLLAELSDRLQLAYLFVSHDLQVVAAIADRVYVMQRGRIVEHGPTDTVFARPQHDYTKMLLAATPRFDQRA